MQDSENESIRMKKWIWDNGKIFYYDGIEAGSTHHFAVYSEDIIDSTLFHLGLAGDQASSIPITFIIPNSQIEEDFGVLEPTSYDLYKKYAGRH